VEVTYAYISDRALLDYVAKVSRDCVTCFSKEAMADYADGLIGDKQATIMLKDFGQSRER
jgi:hypothetical protein